jgi:hypothetical protein
MNKDLNSLEVFLLSILTGVFIAVVYAITSRGSYQLSPVQTLLGFLIFTGWAYILYYSYLTKAGKRIRQEYMDRQLQKAIPPKPQPATTKPQDQSLSIPRLQSELKIVSKKQPTPEQLQDMIFAWKVAKFVKSNAIVFCGQGMTLGVGAGQMSRVDSARIASIKAQNAGLTLAGSVVASDAFFPFRDGLDVVVAAGATAVIQPGGSMRDQEVMDAADEQGVVMALTGVRHFRH